MFSCTVSGYRAKSWNMKVDEPSARDRYGPEGYRALTDFECQYICFCSQAANSRNLYPDQLPWLRDRECLTNGLRVVDHKIPARNQV